MVAQRRRGSRHLGALCLTRPELFGIGRGYFYERSYPRAIV